MPRRIECARRNRFVHPRRPPQRLCPQHQYFSCQMVGRGGHALSQEAQGFRLSLSTTQHNQSCNDAIRGAEVGTVGCNAGSGHTFYVTLSVIIYGPGGMVPFY